MDSILWSPKQSRAAKPDPTYAYPKMEQMVFDRFWERRAEGRIVRHGWFRIASRYYFGEVYKHLDKSQFKFSNGWFLGFLSHWGISIRMTTNKAQTLPEDYRARIISWLQFN